MRQRDTILIVDDMEINRVILSGLFQDEYHLLEAENGEQALLLLKQYHSNIAIMLLDVVMPVMDGYQVMKEMGAGGFLDEVPVVVITADNSLEGELRSFDLGASDIIVKPFEPHVVKRRVHNIIELYLHKHNLEDMVDHQARKLKESNDILVDALSSVIEYRSLESGQHIKRIRLLTRVLLEEVSKNCPEYGLDQQKIEVIASASALHDIGKIAIEDRILNKPGRLTPEEFEIMKTHTIKGCQILDSLGRMSDKEYLQYAYNICHYHHERWDGKGYPEGLCKDAIPICAQAVSVVDAYDALTSDRVYKNAIPYQQAANMILNGECGAFSPKMLECFKTVQPALAGLCRQYADGNVPREHSLSQEASLMPVAEGSVSALQLEQMKYLAMLRYENTMVVEVDFSTGSYHMVYAPNLRIKRSFQGERLEDAVGRYIAEMVDPQDQEYMREAWAVGMPGFFQQGMLKKSWKHRVRDGQGWCWFDLTILRIDIEHPRQRKALLLWKALEAEAEHISAGRTGGQQETGEELQDDVQILHSILKGISRYRNDQWFTILEIDDGFMGYGRDEINSRFHGHYLDMIHPDDRTRVKKELSDQLNHGNEFELEYRVQDADGVSNWVLGKGCLITDQDGQECLYSVIIDINQTKRAQEELRLGLERYKIIMEQTNDIFFEWDIETDTVNYSPNWKGKFGYDPISARASERIPKISHLHPEDMAPFGAFIQQIRSGRRYGELEFKVSDSRGRYQWCKLRATTQFDDQGKPCKAIGIVIDINEEKMAAQELKARAERDTLTRLYNKASARQRIEYLLANREKPEGAALFIIDIDNFKMVNDQYGHMFGDAVLTKIASQLSRLFRSSDIVSRIGGDEFMALLQGVLGDEQVKMVAGRILECFDRVLEELPRECSITSSIGIAVCPRDGDDFQTLFQRADVALYHAKACGKNQYQIYDQSMESRAYGQNAGRQTAANTTIESEGTELVLSDLLPRAFNILSKAEQLDRAVESVLELLGERLQVSRAYVFENSEDNLFYSNTFEWCAEGIEPQKDKMQNMAYSEFDSDYRDYFNERGILYCDDIGKFPRDIRELMESQGIQSMLQCAIKDNGVFKGWVGFDDCTSKCLWTINQIEVLSFISELLSLFLLKQRAQDNVMELAGDLRAVLDHQNSWIYVVDIGTRELLYINEKTQRIAPEAKLGMSCHKAFFGRKEPCARCPMEDIRHKINCTMEVYNPLLKVWSLADASVIRWGKKDACLLACHDITRYKTGKDGPDQEK
ncbi:sensor domain-containing diguanylate cyclase/phosphohydrolase [Enterocloster citroniae]|uniref:sensor domain-containing diguanylate cyclase/phosphohydrolase n=1 Tax=Enterocloster citroniae TaxID=358743 RepID=UPI003044573A|nr:diguanylate cyclase [Enterocloster citroniae]